MSARLDRLVQQNSALAEKSLALPLSLRVAEAAYVEALRVGTEAQVVEAFRLQCVSLYEAKMDLIGEAAAVQRALMEEARRGPDPA